MARSRAFYRAQGKHTWIVTLVVALLVALILLALWLFYDLQRYIVYDKDTLRLVLPKDRTEPTELDSSDEGPGATFTPVNVEIVVDPTDYSAVEAVAGADLRAIHARFLASDSLTQTRLDGLSAGMGDFDSLVLELKPSLGLLRYESSLPLAVSYRVNGSLTLRETAEKLKERDVWLVARLSALVDTTMATRYAPIALKNSNGSGVFMQDGLAWLDPYNEIVRDYLSDLMAELRDMGFDEILFDGLWLPNSPLLVYSEEMTATPDSLSAVSSLAMYLRQEADKLGLRVSVQLQSDALLSMENAKLGQDLTLFFKIFDRIAFETNEDQLSAALTALRSVAGEDDGRLLPISSSTIPGLTSWAIR